jgi:exonuclease V gamma subunit
MGTAMMDLIVEDINELRASLKTYSQGYSNSVIDIHFELDNTLISGKVNSVYGNRYISVCNSSDQLKYLLKAFVIYLGIVASGNTEIEFVFIAKKKKRVPIISAGQISKSRATEILSKYLSYFKTGHYTYFNFFPAIGNNNMKMISEHYEAFWDAYTDAIDDKNSFIFNDEYLDTAVSHGFFAPAVYDRLVSNVQSVFEPLKEQFTDYFPLTKSKK